jgi:hypothetical protein
MAERNHWSRIDTQDRAVIDVSVDDFDDLSSVARNQAFAKALRIVADEIDSPDSIFVEREIDEIKLDYDPVNRLIVTEATLTRY